MWAQQEHLRNDEPEVPCLAGLVAKPLILFSLVVEFISKKGVHFQFYKGSAYPTQFKV